MSEGERERVSVSVCVQAPVVVEVGRYLDHDKLT